MTDYVEAAEKIVRDAMKDRAVYDAMAKKEGEVWGAHLPAREAKGERQNDIRAAAELRLNRATISLPGWAASAGRKFQRGLSIGCGEGRAERLLLQAGVCSSFVGLDVAESALESATAKAREEDLQATYEVADINFATLPENSYDLIIAQTSLHHVVHLENVAEQVHRALMPGGIFWIHDYIGETQFQYTDARIRICNKIISGLAPKHRFNRIYSRQLGPIVRRAPGNLISPFESIRSAEIPSIFPPRFKVLQHRETTSILHLVVPVGTRASYTETEDTRTLFDTLINLDSILLEEKILTPVTGQYVLTK